MTKRVGIVFLESTTLGHQGPKWYPCQMSDPIIQAWENHRESQSPQNCRSVSKLLQRSFYRRFSGDCDSRLTSLQNCCDYHSGCVGLTKSLPFFNSAHDNALVKKDLLKRAAASTYKAAMPADIAAAEALEEEEKPAKKKNGRPGKKPDLQTDGR
ncbi:hypothetical protein B0H19DRAFT_1061656 [Mycena capillaripes]|nr:hypothetical protein B0H19DRAFT_1061656 [Mycena capillaripes]